MGFTRWRSFGRAQSFASPRWTLKNAATETTRRRAAKAASAAFQPSVDAGAANLQPLGNLDWSVPHSQDSTTCGASSGLRSSLMRRALVRTCRIPAS